jgi:hypothetical protein
MLRRLQIRGYGKDDPVGQEVGVVCKEADQFSFFTSRNSRKGQPKKVDRHSYRPIKKGQVNKPLKR